MPDLALVFFIPLAAAAPLIKSWFALDCGQPPLWLWPIFAKSLIGALLGFSIPLAAAIVTGGTGMGGGDIKFCGVLGLIYGPSGMSIVFLVSAVCAMPIILMIRRIYRDRRPLSIRFYPFWPAAALRRHWPNYFALGDYAYEIEQPFYLRHFVPGPGSSHCLCCPPHHRPPDQRKSRNHPYHAAGAERRKDHLG
ncbi:MAG: prepilin peptidase [Enterocloster sp.]|uniref:prepilin peptidase n=1 Tax=Enterocloster sp. TaxID=2719315 RepID=UPI00399A9B88